MNIRPGLRTMQLKDMEPKREQREQNGDPQARCHLPVFLIAL
jgi:hypothetical protein